MKILHLTKKYPKALGGDAVAVSNLEKQQLKKRNKVVVLTSNCDEIKADKRHLKFGLRDTPANLDRITPRRLLSLAALTVKSFSVLRREKPDVLHTHSVDMAFAASFAARWFKVPVVHTFHILTFPDPHHGWLRRKTELLFLKGARPQVVTAPNATDVAHLQNAGVANAHLLPYGIDTEFWSKKHSVKHDVFTFITASRLEDQKGNEYLVRAAAALKKQTKRPFRVVIAGDGSLKQELIALAEQLKIIDIVTFVGRKTPEEMRELYAGSDAMVIPSLWESGPLTAFEAWAMKLPLIITPVGMFATEPQDTKRCKLVPIADAKALSGAMQELLANDKQRRALAAAGYKAAQKHSWAEMRSVADDLYSIAKQPAKAQTTPAKAVSPTAKKTGSGLHFNHAIAGLTLASIAALCAAPALSPTLNTLVTLPLVTFVPGLLALLAAWPEQRSKTGVAASLSAALGVLLIAVEGALANWLLPLFGEHEPLQAKYLVPLHVLSMLVLFGLYMKRRWEQDVSHVSLRVSWQRAARFVVPLALPLLAAAGAYRQNNGASNTITMLTFGLMILAAAWYVWKPKLVSAGWLMFNIALSLLLATSLRSWFVSGFDISQEFQVFTTTLQHHYWDLRALPGNAYNACLSLTTLPVGLQQLTGVSPEVIFKFFYQVLFALTAVLTFQIGRRFIAERLAFLAALLYAAQTQFIGTMPAIARQEIGLLFFGLLAYFLLQGEALTKARKWLLVTLSVGMVLTHYSTTYVAVMVLAITAIAIFALQKLYGRIPRLPKFTPRVSAATLGLLALLLVAFSAVWYSDINHSSGNVVSALRSAAHSHLHLPDTKSSKARLILGGDQDVVKPENVAKYAAQQNLHVPIAPASLPKLPLGNRLLDRAAGIGRTVLGIIIKVVLPLSPIILLLYKKTREKATDIAFISLGGVAVFAAVTILPALSESYNLQRVFQQCLILLGITGVWAMWQLLPAGRRVKTIAVAAFVLLYFALSPGSGLVNQIAGNTQPRLTYNNVGEEYSKYYVRESETLSAQWLAANCQDQAAWADRYATLRLTAYGQVPYDAIRNDILSAKKGCLYLDYANVKNGLFYAQYKKLPVRYTTPAQSFSQYDLIYTNGESQVYKY